MAVFTVFIIALSLAMDSFAVSLGVGTSQNTIKSRTVARMAFHMALFQGGITYLGWLAGSTIAVWISAVDHWVALVLLAFVGLRMIREGLSKEEDCYQRNPTKGGMMLILCAATSIDAFAVGLSLAVINVDILLASLTVGAVTLVLSVVGMLVGSGLGTRFGKRMEILGGVLLNLIGVRIVFMHLFGG